MVLLSFASFLLSFVVAVEDEVSVVARGEEGERRWVVVVSVHHEISKWKVPQPYMGIPSGKLPITSSTTTHVGFPNIGNHTYSLHWLAHVAIHLPCQALSFGCFISNACS